jgi:histidinol-phosphate aminotransferase
VFLCAPSNPAGSDIALDEVERVAVALRGQALVVVDEAYVEYAQRPSATTLLAAHANLAVLRTLSKAHALAAARVGTLIAAPELIAVLRRCQAPYPVPTPCAELAVQALQPAALARTAERVTTVIAERERLRAAWPACPACAGCMPRPATTCWSASPMPRPRSIRCWLRAWWCATSARAAAG